MEKCAVAGAAVSATEKHTGTWTLIPHNVAAASRAKGIRCSACGTRKAKYSCMRCSKAHYCGFVCEMLNWAHRGHGDVCEPPLPRIGEKIQGRSLVEKAKETFCLKSALQKGFCTFSEGQKPSIIPRINYKGDPLSIEALYHILHPDMNHPRHDDFTRMYKISYARVLDFQLKRATAIMQEAEARTSRIIEEFEMQSGMEGGQKVTWKQATIAQKDLYIERHQISEKERKNAEDVVNEIKRKQADLDASFDYDRSLLLADLYDLELDPQNRLIGLRELKEFLASRIQQVIVVGEEFAKNFLNLLLTGDAGTGKSVSVKKALRVYKHLGVLHSPHEVIPKVSRSGVVAGFAGQSAKLVSSLFAESIGGGIAIDEAYSLYNGKGDTFGKEAIDTAVDEMDRLKGISVVAFLGYFQDIMNTIMVVNKGMTRRIPDKIHLKPYTAEELYAIFMRNFADPFKEPTITEGAKELFKQYIVAGVNTVVGVRYPRTNSDEDDEYVVPTQTVQSGDAGEALEELHNSDASSEHKRSCGSGPLQQQQQHAAASPCARGCKKITITEDERAYDDTEVKNLFSDRNAGAMEFIYDRCLRNVSENILSDVVADRARVEFAPNGNSFNLERVITEDVIRGAFVDYCEDVFNEEVELIKFEDSIEIRPRVFTPGSTAPLEAFPDEEDDEAREKKMQKRNLSLTGFLPTQDVLPPPSVKTATTRQKQQLGSPRPPRMTKLDNEDSTSSPVKQKTLGKRRIARSATAQKKQIKEMLQEMRQSDTNPETLLRIILSLGFVIDERNATEKAFTDLDWSRRLKRRVLSSPLTNQHIDDLVEDAENSGFLPALYESVYNLDELVRNKNV